MGGPTAPWGRVPLLGPPAAQLPERVDDANALEVIESRHVLGVEDLYPGFDTRRDNQGVPKRRPMRDMELLRARQGVVGWQDERQQIPEFDQAVPGVDRGKSLFGELARGRQKLAGDLPEENSI